MIRTHRWMVLALVFMAMLPLAAQAQEPMEGQSPPPEAMPDSAPPPASAPQQQTYTPEQIDQMTGQIALYPDPLVSQILMASTYPLDVVEADRWIKDQNNAHLTGDQLAQALQPLPWDPSVKSLVQFPQVLDMMDNNLQWTEQLGDAFLANQGAVMDSVQRLRHMAQASGHLQSTPQQTVTTEPAPQAAPVPPVEEAPQGQPIQEMQPQPMPQAQGPIVIMPADPQVVYVPSYNPTVVYGAWPYAAYPPYYFPPPPGYYFSAGGLFAFGVGIAVVDWLWGWNSWDWYHRRIDIDDGRFAELNRGHAPHFAGDAWEHNPAHRHGVPYLSGATRARFQGAADTARRNFRGFATPAAVPRARALTGVANNGGTRAANVQSQARTGQSFRVQSQPSQRPSGTFESREASPAVRQQPQELHTQAQVRQPQTQQRRQSQPQAQQRSSPVFESFSRGPDVRAQSQRGAYSRSTTPAAAPRFTPAARSAPAGHAAPSGGGGHDDHDRNH